MVPQVSLDLGSVSDMAVQETSVIAQAELIWSLCSTADQKNWRDYVPGSLRTFFRAGAILKALYGQGCKT